MIILGLHKDPWHNSGAAVVKDVGGKVDFACISEERLNREKDSRKFPQLSIAACMRQLGVNSFDEIDLVVTDYIINPDWAADTINQKPIETEFFSHFKPEQVIVINHHLSHAYSTFYSSRFKSAAILIVDGRGSDKETQSLFHASLEPQEMRLIDHTDCMGIGLLYACITQKIGFANLQEGKTMGLAPYGEKLGRKLWNFPHNYDGVRTDYSECMIEDTYRLSPEYDAVQVTSDDDKAIGAWDVQDECEKALLHLAKYAQETTGEKYLCMSGGVALNSVANNTVLKSGIFEDIFINPACSDTGIPLGCALYGYHAVMGQPKQYELISPYLGGEYSDTEIIESIEEFKGEGFEKFEVIQTEALEQAIDLLARNKIVAVHQGRSEMGPRALGNRSILMSPLVAENKDVLNARVKHREGFRPFAPAVLEERASEYFDLDRESPYMLLVPDVWPDKRAVIPAVTHVDGTGRVQTLTPERNKHFYKIVKEFGERTGVPVILNTSFNVAGEPIVETPQDSIRCFLGTDIDALFIGSYLLEKVSARDGIEEEAQDLVGA
jgi:carbamoyltransferase